MIRPARTDRAHPVASLGQGDYRRDDHAEDRGVHAASAAPEPSSDALLEAELIGAALRYVVVADWFEHLPTSHRDPQRERRAMDTFNRIEAELRQAGGRLLRRPGHRRLVLGQVLEEAARA